MRARPSAWRLAAGLRRSTTRAGVRQVIPGPGEGEGLHGLLRLDRFGDTHRPFRFVKAQGDRIRPAP